MITEDSPLRGKQPAFVDNYFICNFNGTEAARKTGYKGSDNTLAAIAYENLRKPHIQKAIKERMKRRTMQADEVLYRISQHAAGSMADFVTVNTVGDFEVDLKTASALGKLGLVQELTETTSTTKEGVQQRKFKIKLYSAKDALNLLARHYKLFADADINLHAKIEVPGLTDAINKIYGQSASSPPEQSTEDSP
ncbi:MAG: terminase small subunit [Anaerolineales bacterium]|nr:terminase small subunit [Anaerolineales bacterium]